MEITDIKSVLFIRRDNIGDLVCTTPAIRALRQRYPKARICVLANSYNAEAVRNNPDVDEVFVYEKEKHSEKGRLSAILSNFSAIRRIRGQRFDAAIGCAYGYSRRLARYSAFTGARFKIGFGPKDASGRLFYNVAVAEPKEPVHEVEAMMRLVEPLGVSGPPPSMLIRPDEEEVKKALLFVKRFGSGHTGQRLVAFHISSRRPQNRWQREKFRDLGDRLQETGIKVMLMWAPGSKTNVRHPGDDEDADWIISTMKKRPLAYRTGKLGELIAGLSLADSAVCLDGGAMHIAAALGKPVLAIWGSTDKRRWAPWGVPNIVLQDGSKEAANIAVDDAFYAFGELSKVRVLR